MTEARKHFEEAHTLLQSILNSTPFIEAVDRAAATMIHSLSKGGKIISCGNGGSMCDAMHFAEELSGRYREDRKALAAISISDPSHMSCVGNDYGYDFVFSRYVEAVGKEGDILLGITTSGNSKNIIKAAEAAKAQGMKVVALTGNTGGALADLCDVEVRVPFQGYADRIQEVHIKVIHSLIDSIERKLA